MEKKQKVLCLSLLLVLSLLLSACAAELPTKAAGTNKNTAEETEATEAPKETLWGRNVSYKEKEIPKKAFSGGAERCTMLAPDGVTLLMGGGVSPYLYNMETGKTTPLVPADQETEEILRYYIQRRLVSSAARQNLTEEQLEAQTARLQTLSGQALTEELCTELGRIYPLRLYSVSFTTADNYLLLTDTHYMAPLLLDCGSGKYYSLFEEDLTLNYCCLEEGRLLYCMPYNSKLKLRDLKSGETETFQADADGKSVTLEAAVFLPDGGIAALGYDPVPAANDTLMYNYYLMVRKAGSRSWDAIPLGAIPYNRAPDQLSAVGTDGIVISGYQSAVTSAPLFVDLTQRTVLRLAKGEDGLIRLLTQEEYDALNETDFRAANGLRLIDRLSDGETLLFQDLGNSSGTLLLFHGPDGGSQKFLESAGTFPLLQDFSGNHYDRFSFTLTDRTTGSRTVLYELKIR